MHAAAQVATTAAAAAVSIRAVVSLTARPIHVGAGSVGAAGHVVVTASPACKRVRIGRLLHESTILREWQYSRSCGMCYWVVISISGLLGVKISRALHRACQVGHGTNYSLPHQQPPAGWRVLTGACVGVSVGRVVAARCAPAVIGQTLALPSAWPTQLQSVAAGTPAPRLQTATC